MQQFTIGPNEAGQRLDKYLLKLLNKAPSSFIQKMLRKKNIVLNDKKADGITKTAVGDVVKIYMTDETIANFRDIAMAKDQKKPEAKITDHKEPSEKTKYHVPVIYQDEHVLVLNKPKGLLSQRAVETDYSLVDYVRDYVLEHHILTPKELETFQPGICNRLDRNTTGLVIAGLSLQGLQQLNEAIKKHRLHKYYACVVKGTVSRPYHVVANWNKNEKTNTVTITGSKELPMDEIVTTGDKNRIETKFWPVLSENGYTFLKVELLTGKTHQIRAQLHALGFDLVGEQKYTDQKKKSKEYTSQLLHCYQIRFPKLKSPLENLSEKQLEAPLPKEFTSYIKR